jgi:hypothetical protein
MIRSGNLGGAGHIEPMENERNMSNFFSGNLMEEAVVET